jgi:3-oxoacyl-[acyl-carrier-protein] synthase-3
LTDRELSRTGNRLLAGVMRANTAFNDLCQSDRDEAAGNGMQPLMQTDSERLMREGVATGVDTFQQLLNATGWDVADIDKTFCHQVGSAHRRLMLESLSLRESSDFSTFPWLGNTGSAALPITMAIGLESGHVEQGDHIAMLGIGSGINSLMMGVQWERAQVRGTPHPHAKTVEVADAADASTYVAS